MPDREEEDMKSRLNPMLAISLAGLIGAATTASAAGRHVSINGERMSGAQLAVLDSAHCMAIPDGDYFLTEVASGVYVWGYAAFPGVPIGYLGEECQAQASSYGGGHGGGYGAGNSGGESFGSVPWYGSTEEGSMIYGGAIPDGSGGFE
jgi:hypothetical protein